jgi:ankyrin repeat protein
MRDTVERVGRLIEAATCRAPTVLEAAAREGERGDRAVTAPAASAGGEAAAEVGGDDTAVPRSAGRQGAGETRGDHVAVLEWYRSAVSPQHVGGMVVEDDEGKAQDSDDAQEEMEEEELLASMADSPATPPPLMLAGNAAHAAKDDEDGGLDESSRVPLGQGAEGAEDEQVEEEPADDSEQQQPAAREPEEQRPATRKRGESLSADDEANFREWTLSRDLDNMEALLKYLSDAQKAQLANLPLLEETHPDGGALLHHIASIGSNEIARVLLAAGARASERDALGNTPMHLAVKGGHPQLLKILTDGGASINAKNDSKHETPLHCAAAKGDLEAVSHLVWNSVAAGAAEPLDCEAQLLGSRQTAFLLACEGAHVDIARKILEHSPTAAHSFSASLDNGAHLLLLALHKRKAATSVGPDELADKAGGSAEEDGDFVKSFLETLVEHGCDIFSKNSDGLSPAALARKLRLTKAFEILEGLNNPTVQGDLEKALAECTCSHCFQLAELRRDALVQKDDGAALSSLLLKSKAFRCACGV